MRKLLRPLGYRLGLEIVIPLVLVTILILSVLPFLSSVLGAMNVNEALVILGQNNYVAYANPVGDLIVTGDIDLTGDLNTTGDINGATGRTATFIVAASDSSALSIAQADYVCDGTDDQVEIQAAIDALDPVTRGGVLLLEGRYYLSAAIDIDHNDDYMTLTGVGKGTRLIKAFNGTMIAAGLNDSVLWNITIRDMWLDGVSATYTGDAIVATRVGRPIIENLYIDNVEGIGIHARGNTTDFSFGPMILNNNISDTGSHGILCDGKIELPLIQGNDIQRAGGDGIKVGDNAKYARIYNNWIEGADGIAINVFFANNGEVIGNQINVAGADGIKINGEHNTVMGNTIEGASGTTTNTDSGISIGNADDTLVLGNQIMKSSNPEQVKYAVEITQVASQRVVIRNNVFQDFATAAILDSGNGTLITNNTGYVTENWGTGTITGTSIAIAHGLAVTPTHVTFTGKEDPTNPVESMWWTADGTDVTYNVETDPGAGDWDFSWEAKVR